MVQSVLLGNFYNLQWLLVIAIIEKNKLIKNGPKHPRSLTFSVQETESTSTVFLPSRVRCQ